jgi:phosphatidylglycerophosphate synthase
MFVEEYLRDLRRRRYRFQATVEYIVRCMRMSFWSAWHRPKALTWVVVAGLGHLVLLLGLAVLLSFLLDRTLAIDYFIFSAWWLMGGLAWITLHLGMFRTDKELPMSGLGLPNFLTLGRLLSIPAFYLFITRGHEELALVAFLLGGLSDVADGIAARKLNASTKMGRIFDPIVDVFFNVGVAMGLTRAGYLPEWILVLVFFRYLLLMFGAAWIYITHGPVAVRPTALGKTIGVISTGLIFGVIIVVNFLSAGAAEQVLELLYTAIGFGLLITIVQVVIIGIFNLRYAGEVPEASGPLKAVVGSTGTDEKPAPHPVTGGEGADEETGAEG